MRKRKGERKEREWVVLYYEKLMLHEQDIIFAWLLGDLSEYICIFVVSWRGIFRSHFICICLQVRLSGPCLQIPKTHWSHIASGLCSRRKGAKAIWKSRHREACPAPWPRYSLGAAFVGIPATGHSPSTSAFPGLPSILLLITRTCLWPLSLKICFLPAKSRDISVKYVRSYYLPNMLLLLGKIFAF